jgi:hypothetical protein
LAWFKSPASSGPRIDNARVSMVPCNKGSMTEACGTFLRDYKGAEPCSWTHWKTVSTTRKHFRRTRHRLQKLTKIGRENVQTNYRTIVENSIFEIVEKGFDGISRF